MCKQELCGVRTKLGVSESKGVDTAIPQTPVHTTVGELPGGGLGRGQDSQPQEHVLALGLRLEIPVCLPAAQAGLFLLQGPAPEWAQQLRLTAVEADGWD